MHARLSSEAACVCSTPNRISISIYRTEQLRSKTKTICTALLFPLLLFRIASLDSVQKLRLVYTTYDLLDADAEIVLNGLLKMYQKILAICKKEAAGKLISDEENRWIPVITAELEKYVSVHNGFDAAYTNDDDRTKDGSRPRKGARRFIRCARVSARTRHHDAHPLYRAVFSERPRRSRRRWRRAARKPKQCRKIDKCARALLYTPKQKTQFFEDTKCALLFHTTSYELSGKGEDDITSYYFSLFY